MYTMAGNPDHVRENLSRIHVLKHIGIKCRVTESERTLFLIKNEGDIH